MPSSYVVNVPSIISAMGLNLPRRVVDVGPGWGKYGLMAREYFTPEIVDAVEVTEGRLPTQDVIYDRVVEADARELAPEFWHDYDMVLLIDVIEHMTLDEGHELLWRMQSGGSLVLVSTPHVFVEQHDEDNPYETHVSVWAWQDFQPHGIGGDFSTGESIIYLLPPRARPKQ